MSWLNPQHTFKVSSMDRNFLWSPISMAQLTMGNSVFTASSMGMGGTFSPPAVMMSSGEQGRAPLSQDASLGPSPGGRSCRRHCWILGELSHLLGDGGSAQGTDAPPLPGLAAQNLTYQTRFSSGPPSSP